MQVRCSLCGGENELQPGQEMLRCSYCGSALAVDGRSGPEHLILPHERNDRRACEELCSFLLTRCMPRPKDIKVDFSYVPFLVIEDGSGHTTTLSAAAKAPPGADALPYPPAGSYRFFDERLAGAEKIVPAAKDDKDATRVLHLPVYRMHYHAAGEAWNASAIGESWQVCADGFPPEQPAGLNMQNVLIAAGMLVACLFIGKLGHGWLSRFVLMFGAGAAGFTLVTLRKRLAKT